MQDVPIRTCRSWLTLFIAIILLFSQTSAAFAGNLPDRRQDDKTNDSGPTGSLGQAEAVAEEADPEGAVQELEGVESAVVQIEAVGTFRDPEEGTIANAAGRGSGFIIDPSGIAVTNNPVVTGAGFLKVFIAREEKARNAHVRVFSVCYSLKVINILGDGFPYLAWYDEAAKVGLDIYAAGFPLGDPEYTLVKGIVAKAKADGETSWASVDHVIQHDASTNPGNSGGPVITEDGQVVGVHYAGNAETGQAFAIAEDVARPIVQQLRTGIDIDSIGLNAEAVSNGKDFSGIWVSSVASGSPADNAGLLPGDIIMEMEGIVLATQGTMSEYCDILRSHDMQGDVLSIKVLRTDTEEVLEGQLNGRPLETSFSLADQAVEDGTATEESGNAAPTYETYVPIQDSAKIISIEAPEEWSDVQEGDWTMDDKVVGFRLLASTDLDKFFDDWGLPGVIVNYSEELVGDMGTDELADYYEYSKDCQKEGKVEELPGDFFTGHYKSWEECGAEGKSSTLLVSLTPAADPTYIVLLEVYAAGAADLEATDRILDSLVLNGGGSANQSGNTGNESSVSEEEILAAVDTSGLKYEYTLAQEEAISALIPADWIDQERQEWTNDAGDTSYGMIFTASGDLAGFNDPWKTAGVQVRSATDLTEDIDIDEWLDADVEALKDDCRYGKSRKETSHEIVGQSWAGSYDVYTRCGKTNNTYYIAALNSVPTGSFVYVQFMTLGSADKEAFEVFMQSFFVNATSNSGPATQASDLVTVSDDSGQISVNVPTAWSDLKSEDWMGNGDVLGPSFYAAADASAFGEDYTVPGLFIGVGPGLLENVTVDTMLDTLSDLFKEECTYDDRYDYADEKLTGLIDTFTNCGKVEGEVLSVLAVAPNDNPKTLVVVFVNSPTSDDTIDFAQVLAPLDVADVTIDGTSSASESGSNGSESGTNGSESGSSTSDEEPVTTVDVVAQTLNVREGPGTGYKVIATVKKGETLGVLGMAQNCSWLYVLTENVDLGWVAGSAQYVQFSDGSCSDLEDVSFMAPAAPSGGTSSGGASSGGTQAGGNSGGNANASKGCIQFQNHIGLEATVTITNKDNGKAETFAVAKNQDLDKCFDPGKYALTIDVPPPWDSINADIELNAGDYYSFPIQGE